MKELIKQAKQGDAEAQYLLELTYIECYFLHFSLHAYIGTDNQQDTPCR